MSDRDYSTGHQRRQERLHGAHLAELHRRAGTRAGEPLAAAEGTYACPSCTSRYTTADAVTQHWTRRHARNGRGASIPSATPAGAAAGERSRARRRQ